MKFSALQDYLTKRLDRKITQAEIATALNLDKSSVSLRIKRESYLNQRHVEAIEHFYGIKLDEKSSSYDNDDCITLERIHINPSCGSGTMVFDEADVTPITLGKKLIQNIFKVENLKNLKVFRASGDSMEDTIYSGDDVLVDIGDCNFNNGGVFIIEKFNDWFIKRLRLRLDGNLEIISDNKKYETEIIKYESDIKISIKGKVIKNLSRGL